MKKVLKISGISGSNEGDRSMDLGESSEDEEEIEESLKVEVRLNKPVKETNQVRDNESKNELERE